VFSPEDLPAGNRLLTDDRGFTKRAPKPVSPPAKPRNSAKSTHTRKAAKASI
jgi:hypothetical protein